MIEYLYNAIRATAGNDITIAAELTNTSGEAIAEGCHLMLFDPEKKLIATIDGVCNEAEWSFTIPAELTKGLNGRYWYCICHYNTNLCFKQPIYLV